MSRLHGHTVNWSAMLTVHLSVKGRILLAFQADFTTMAKFDLTMEKIKIDVEE